MAVFSNRATLTYNGISTDSNLVTGEILESLSVTKTATGETYGVGDSISYAVAIVNTGTIPYTNLTVTDDLGAYPFGTGTLVPLDYVDGSAILIVNGTPAAPPAPTATSPLTFSGINVPAGGNAVLVYRATANEYAPPLEGGSVTNTVTVSGGGLTAPITASETVTAASGASLDISKALSPVTVSENGEITYTLLISNTGNTAVIATDNASVTDTFSPALTNVTVTYNGTAWTEGVNYTYDPTSGLFTTLPGQITVPAATYTQDPTSGAWSVTPGTAIISITGND